MGFSAQVDDFIANSEALLLAVVQDASQEMIIAAENPTIKGGNMRVDTGFLRNSLAAAIGTMPSGESVNPGAPRPEWDPTAVLAVIQKMRLGETIYFGWTANYAEARESKDFFMRNATQRWQEFVTNSGNKLKAALK